jgi:hypothetical protein
LPWQIRKASLKTFFSRRKPGNTDFKLARGKESLLLLWQIRKASLKTFFSSRKPGNADFQDHSPGDFHHHSPTPGVCVVFF